MQAITILYRGSFIASLDIDDKELISDRLRPEGLDYLELTRSTETTVTIIARRSIPGMFAAEAASQEQRTYCVDVDPATGVELEEALTSAQRISAQQGEIFDWDSGDKPSCFDVGTDYGSPFLSLRPTGAEADSGLIVHTEVDAGCSRLLISAGEYGELSVSIHADHASDSIIVMAGEEASCTFGDVTTPNDVEGRGFTVSQAWGDAA